MVTVSVYLLSELCPKQGVVTHALIPALERLRPAWTSADIMFQNNNDDDDDDDDDDDNDNDCKAKHLAVVLGYSG